MSKKVRLVSQVIWYE